MVARQQLLLLTHWYLSIHYRISSDNAFGIPNTQSTISKNRSGLTHDNIRCGFTTQTLAGIQLK